MLYEGNKNNFFFFLWTGSSTLNKETCKINTVECSYLLSLN